MKPRTATARNQRAAATAISSLAAKGLAGVVTLVSIPLTLPYLGPERLGLWMTIASLQAILAFADFGLGNSVLNTVAAAAGRGENELVGRAVRAALVLQGAVAALLLAAFFTIYPSVDWHSLLNVHGGAATSEAAPALAVFVAAYAIRSVVVVIQQAQFGLQQGYIANAWTAAGNVAALGAIIVAARLRCGVPILCLAATGLPVAAGVMNAIWWTAFRLKRSGTWLSGTAERRLLANMMGVGMQFFLLQVFAALNVGVDPLIVNRTLGPAAVASLSIVQKPFELLSAVLLLLLQPLWPAYREAVASGEVAWVRTTFRRTFIAVLACASLVALLMTAAGSRILGYWVGTHVPVPGNLIGAYSAVLVFSGMQAPLAFLFNGLGKIRFQLVLGIPAVAASITLKYVLSARIGLVSIPWVTFGIGVSIMAPVQIAYLRQLLKQLQAQESRGSADRRAWADRTA